MIWFHAIREFRSEQRSLGKPDKDVILSRLIRAGLGDMPDRLLPPGTVQLTRYSAILASRLQAQLLKLEKGVCRSLISRLLDLIELLDCESHHPSKQGISSDLGALPDVRGEDREEL